MDSKHIQKERIISTTIGRSINTSAIIRNSACVSSWRALQYLAKEERLLRAHLLVVWQQTQPKGKNHLVNIFIGHRQRQPILSSAYGSSRRAPQFRPRIFRPCWSRSPISAGLYINSTGFGMIWYRPWQAIALTTHGEMPIYWRLIWDALVLDTEWTIYLITNGWLRLMHNFFQGCLGLDSPPCMHFFSSSIHKRVKYTM